MALTFGDVTNLILAQTNRDAPTYGAFVQSAILSAITFMETECPYIFEKIAEVTITQGNNSVNLPPDWNQPVYVSYQLDGTIYGTLQGFLPSTYQDLIRIYNTTEDTGNPSKYAFFTGQLYVYPYTSGDITFTLSYYYTDASVPSNPTDSSVWFNPNTIDCVVAKATELFYTYPLQTPEIGQAYAASYASFLANLEARNNIQRQNNLISI
jgi:hypothetical protein